MPQFSSALPQRYLITPEPQEEAPFSAFLNNLDVALQAGIRLVQLRAKRLSPSQYARLAELALTICRAHGARLLLNSPAALVRTLHADGVHLSSTALMHCKSRPLPDAFLVSAACHDETQIRHACLIAADLLTISPVLPTETHPEALPLGWERFKVLASSTRIPAYALGGMNDALIDSARDAGAHGIAAIRAFWPDAHPQ